MCRERRRNERGMTLLEVMMALILLSVVLISLVGLMFQMGRHTIISGQASLRAAAVQNAAAWALSAPWDSLAAIAGCQDDSVGTFTYTQCITLRQHQDLDTVLVVITPTSTTNLLADTVMVNRIKPIPLSPLRVSP